MRSFSFCLKEISSFIVVINRFFISNAWISFTSCFCVVHSYAKKMILYSLFLGDSVMYVRERKEANGCRVQDCVSPT